MTTSKPPELSSQAPSEINSEDQAFMQRVLDLAVMGATSTQPNPRVACVIVKDGLVVGEGFHQTAGESHAERLALQQAGAQSRGATAYVNLEPCCHQGRTPPCTDGLIDAGISRVVAAMRDPNPLVEGGGFELLQGAGIEVEAGVLEDQARWLNRGFVSRMVRQKPWVMLKSAATLDGRTAAYDGESKWITSTQARESVQALRAACSAVVTGIGTVLADDPQMDVRLDNQQRQPLRVVLDSKLQMPLEARIIGADQNLMIFTVSEDLEKTAALIEAGAEVVHLQANAEGQLDLLQVLEELAKWQCNEVFIEAGQTLSGAFVQAGLVDELVLFYAGSVLGDQGKSMFKFNSPMPFQNKAHFQVSSTEMVGDDVRVNAINAASLADLRQAQQR
ncbi:MAG: bifunctional diaminohydroxyphosphoribosylaminopyrimidine deaminase/5-amino-6-(5-phosphoribosylamino)uracil reductase RibD [Arenicella sp.]|nr:bifunctional diaminohydroxyphosphoribosylaminopyrimidine deaminase/5-amino-6-(5-phosphoribosylamino)uracil reductase RibD [Arenicella sp.]